MSPSEGLVIGKIHTTKEIKKALRNDPILKVMVEDLHVPKRKAIEALANFLNALEAGIRRKEPPQQGVLSTELPAGYATALSQEEPSEEEPKLLLRRYRDKISGKKAKQIEAKADS